MQAKTGDQLVVRNHQVGNPDRVAEVLEARGSEGGPPFLVRWQDGHESLFFPAADSVVQPPPAP